MNLKWKALAVGALMTVPGAVQAQGTASVAVNGQMLSFDQPPIIQQGRVLVPLRGIFEHLGATVVYDPMTKEINATSSTGQSVALTLGSRQAMIGGQSFLLDVPARSVAGRTLVPLRFVAESLGAEVVWQPASRMVSITSGGVANNPPVVNPPVINPPVSAVIESTISPAAGSIVGTLQPTIRATFADAINPETARLVVDGRDMTANAQISQHEVVWVPNYQLASGSHLARVDAVSLGGTPVRADWGFVLNPGTVSGYNIYSINVGPDRPIQRGEQVLVTMQGVPNGTATFDIGGTRGIPMREVRPGIYEGTYTVTARDQADATVVVHLSDPAGQQTSLTADERAALWGNPALR